jgi:chemotaxis protein histidine kinase CheA
MNTGALDIIAREAHAAKGAASTLEAGPLAHAAKALELAAVLCDKGQLQAAFDSKNYEFGKLRAFIQSYLEGRDT